MSRKGFTLVEVIAVILILGIIAAIVMPIIKTNLEEVRMKSFKESVNQIIRSGSIYASKHQVPKYLDEPIVFACDGETCVNEKGDKLNFKGEIPTSGDIVIYGLNDVKASYVSNNTFCANGIRGKLNVGKSCSDIDITIPKVVSITQNQRVFTIKLLDKESGIKAYCLINTNDSNSCTWTNTNTTTVEETLTTSGTYYVFAKDKKDNISESKSFETGDIQDPTIPTSGSIGLVSGSNTTGTIQNPVSGSTDESEITYKYLVTNTNSKPDKYDTNFTTSRDFARSCGKTYYGWAVAEDTNGYRSEVYALGSTQDGANSYSGWTTCSKTCGGGTQTRTNSCALVTTGLSQNCNTQACCAYAVNKYWDYNYTGGVQSFTVPCKGTYQLQVYGAQGGNNGGKGGYSVGNVTLNANTVLYVVVGGAGTAYTNTSYTYRAGGYNGGGPIYTGDDASGQPYTLGTGGGATHIGKSNALLSSTAVGNLYIAAGGGGGAKTNDCSSAVVGTGGGTTGGSAKCMINDGTIAINTPGASQSAGGSCGTCSTANGINNNGRYGQGGLGCLNISYALSTGAGGGGGYYGGASCDYGSGGGGSGYIGGVTGGSMSNGQRAGNGFARITLKTISN